MKISSLDKIQKSRQPWKGQKKFTNKFPYPNRMAPQTFPFGSLPLAEGSYPYHQHPFEHLNIS